MEARPPRLRRQGQREHPPGPAQVVPLQASTPDDPRVHLPDTQRETVKEVRGETTTTTYIDPPLDGAPLVPPQLSAPPARRGLAVTGEPARTGKPGRLSGPWEALDLADGAPPEITNWS